MSCVKWLKFIFNKDRPQGASSYSRKWFCVNRPNRQRHRDTARMVSRTNQYNSQSKSTRRSLLQIRFHPVQHHSHPCRRNTSDDSFCLWRRRRPLWSAGYTLDILSRRLGNFFVWRNNCSTLDCLQIWRNDSCRLKDKRYSEWIMSFGQLSI